MTLSCCGALDQQGGARPAAVGAVLLWLLARLLLGKEQPTRGGTGAHGLLLPLSDLVHSLESAAAPLVAAGAAAGRRRRPGDGLGQDVGCGCGGLR